MPNLHNFVEPFYRSQKGETFCNTKNIPNMLREGIAKSLQHFQIFKTSSFVNSKTIGPNPKNGHPNSMFKNCQTLSENCGKSVKMPIVQKDFAKSKTLKKLCLLTKRCKKNMLKFQTVSKLGI